MKKLSLLLLFNLLLLKCFSADLDNTMLEANKAYSAQDYNKAIELYKSVITKGYSSFKLYYNLGNAYFKANDIPSAIYYYEKASLINPSDEDLNFNLQLANTRITDKIEVMPEFFIKNWTKIFFNQFSADNWALLTISFFIIFFVILLLFLLSKSFLLRKILLWLSVCSLFLFVVFFFSAQRQYKAENNNKDAIVFTPTVQVKSSPDDNSTDIFVIHEGLKVRVLDNVKDWYEVRIGNGSKGWLKITDVKIIE